MVFSSTIDCFVHNMFINKLWPVKCFLAMEVYLLLLECYEVHTLEQVGIFAILFCLMFSLFDNLWRSNNVTHLN